MHLVYYAFECPFCFDSDCIFDGKFCQIDTENWQQGAGNYILQEQFRQYNLFEQVKGINEIDTWFNYMNKFDENCDDDWINSNGCSRNILDKMGFTKYFDEGDELAVMSKWREKESKAGLYVIPGVTVNGVKHMENLTP